MKLRIILISPALFISGFVWSQQQTNMIQAGNDFFKLQQFEKAAGEYNKVVLADPSNLTAKYNLAISLYKSDKQDEAAALFITVATDAKEADLRSKAWYNKGVILTKQKKLEESIEAYKNALRQDPNDNDARENLQKALLELKKKTPPEKKQEPKNNKKQEKPKPQPQSKMSPKEAQQRLKLLEQKEKEVQQRLQKTKTGAGQAKDW